MLELLRRIFVKEKVHVIKFYPFGLEVSDGDRAAVYGWPDVSVNSKKVVF